MNPYNTATGSRNLRPWEKVLLSIAAVAAFHLAYLFPPLSFLIVIYLWCLVELTRLETSRQASYIGLAIGMACGAPQLHFFWVIFGPGAIVLWFVFAFWIRMFLVLGRACRHHLASPMFAVLLPFIWLGLEYFRSELYYLRFSWLNAGYTFASNPGWLPINLLGVYGIGFILMAAVTLIGLLPRVPRNIAYLFFLIALGIMTSQQRSIVSESRQAEGNPFLIGVQMEFPSETEVLAKLNEVNQHLPSNSIIVLSEYTFDGPVPELVKNWCGKNSRYLIVGGKAPTPQAEFFNTAFVVGPKGDIVFQQAKCVPIQFMKDGLPAAEQKLWHSPWGDIGICICYDLSYTRVTDELIRQGAQALIVPTMDVVDWGVYQHQLHGRIALTRAAEYGVPIFRVASSGISQSVAAGGRLRAATPAMVDGALLSCVWNLDKPGKLPFDRILAPVAVGITILTAGWLCVITFRRRSSILPQTQELEIKP